MARHCFALGLVLAIFGLTYPEGVAKPLDEEGGKKSNPPANAPSWERLARHLWYLTDIVLDNHIEPPTRQEMLLGAAQALLKTAKKNPPLHPPSK